MHKIRGEAALKCYQDERTRSTMAIVEIVYWLRRIKVKRIKRRKIAK